MKTFYILGTNKLDKMPTILHKYLSLIQYLFYFIKGEINCYDTCVASEYIKCKSIIGGRNDD